MTKQQLSGTNSMRKRGFRASITAGVFWIAIAFCGSWGTAYAASDINASLSALPETELYFVTNVQHIVPASEITVSVLLTTAVPVNALDIELGYSGQLIDFVRAESGKSVVSIWRRTPEVLHEGIIRIQGGMVPPFQGHAGEIAQFTFRVRPGVSGDVQWSFRSAQVFRADGRGTAAIVAPLLPLSLPIISGASVPSEVHSVDVRAPRIDAARVARNPTNQKYLGIWNASDSDSGIKQSEVRFRTWFTWGSWVVRDNPVALPSGTWSFAVRVTDNAGNVAEQTLILWQTLLSKLGLLFFFAALMVYGMRRRRHRQHFPPFLRT